jgi:hypothetical protein
MENVGSINGHLEYSRAIWNLVGPFGSLVVIWYIFYVLVYCSKKNLATQSDPSYVTNCETIHSTESTRMRPNYAITAIENRDKLGRFNEQRKSFVTEKRIS